MALAEGECPVCGLKNCICEENGRVFRRREIISIFRNSRCYNGGSQHKFEPRFDEKPSGIGVTKLKNMWSEDIRSLLIINVYIHDICVWCGKTVEKKEK